MLESILEINKKVLGPIPSFTPAHVILAILVIKEKKSIGRQALAKELELGEGATRTVIKKLTELNAIERSVVGCQLTKKGEIFAKKLLEILRGPVDIPRSSLTIGNFQAAILFRNVCSKVKDGISQRDQAIIHGADGATTYIFKSGKFTMPNSEKDFEKEYPDEAWNIIRKTLNPEENDVIIVCGATTSPRARLGCIAAGLTLI